MKLLIVDDNADYLFLLQSAISAGGYNVFTARDGADGIDVLDSEGMDLIISDILMPRLDGIRLHSYVRKSPRYARTKFIFVSGFKEIYENVVILDPTLDFFHDKTNPSDEILDFVSTLVNGDHTGHSQGALS